MRLAPNAPKGSLRRMSSHAAYAVLHLHVAIILDKDERICAYWM